jgi:hypothetical protein
MANGRSAPVYVISAQPEGAAGAAQRVDISDRVTSFSFTETEKGLDKLTLSVQNQDFGNLSNQVLAQGTTLTFNFGYADGTMSPQRKATVVKVTGGTVLAVEAKGGAFLLGLQPKTRTFTQISRGDVARQIAKENGFNAANTFIGDASITQAQITQANISDLGFLNALAKKEGWYFVIDALGFHFRQRDLGQPPRRSFIYFTDPGQGDLLGAPHIETDATAKPGAVVVRGIDPKTGKPMGAVADNTQDSGRGGLGSILGFVGGGANGAAGKSASSTGSQGQAQAINGQNGSNGARRTLGQDKVMATTAKSATDATRQAQGAYQRVQLTALKINFPAIGDPLFSAKSVFTLGGAVGTLAGNFYAVEVKHDLGSEYKMTVKGRSDARLSGGAAPAPVKSTAAVNTGKGPAPTATPDTTLAPHQTQDPRTGAPRTTFVPQGTPPTGSK